jgi:1-acyl-sn-glycerol-3-phosphate acyltransferase
MNKDKIINSRCICGLGLSWKEDIIVMLEPCEHLIHRNCITSNECPFCKTKIEKLYRENELKKLIKKDPKYYQKYIDIVCMKNVNNICRKDMTKIITNLPTIMDIIGRIPFSKGFNEGHKLCRDAFSLANVKLTIIGRKNITTQNKIIISNHTSIMDFMVMFYIFKCGFLASNSVKETMLGKMISEIIPILFIDRGKDTNTVEKMKEYVNKRGSLCLFPEGIIVHPETLAQFRTGAFYTDQPILPVVINYNPVVNDSSVGEFFQKFASQNSINVTVRILPIEHPPFTIDRINLIRKKMAKAGDLALSRVSNRDAVDK